MAHAGSVNGVDISPDGSLIVSGGSDGRVGIWKVADGSKLHTLGEYRQVSDVSFSPDGQRVICAATDSGKNEVLHIWDYQAEKVRVELEGHSQKINTVAYSPNGKMIASGSDDNTLRTWYAGNGRDIHTFEDKKNDVLAVSWSPDSGRLAGGLSWNGNIQIWDIGWDKLEITLSGHRDWVQAVLFSPDGRKFISGSRDGSIRIWDTGSGKETGMTRESWWGGINDLAISGDGSYLAGATEANSVVVWYADSGRTLAVLPGHSGPVKGVAFSADGGTIVSGGADGAIKIWTAPGFGAPEALFNLAARHDKGAERIKQDKAEAFKWYLKSATAGFPRAMTRVGEMLDSGEGTAVNRQEAVKWLTAAAAGDDIDAMYLLGDIYAGGRGVTTDPDKAAALWARAAEKGHSKARLRLGKTIEALDIKTVDSNSLSWLEKAAGNGDIKAMYDLALIYGRGTADVNQDVVAAGRWFTEAARLGHSDAQYNLGKIHATGTGVKRSGEEAAFWWSKAAAQGQVDALYQLGISYLEGKGVKQDDREAARLLKQAAAKGNSAAKYRLALLYYTGRGVGRDYSRAVKLWQEAAEAGDSMAKFFLGHVYETGSGVKRDSGLAGEYYKDAAGRGNPYAEQARKP
ncbi:MAG: hypothetical protein ABR605_03175 [Desulfurivibrionaceae bacterium]